MASIHRVKRSPYWYGAIYLPDGRRTLRSTGTTDKRKARKIVDAWDQAAREGREKRLTERRSREVLAEIFQLANDEPLPCATLRSFLDAWLRKKKLEVSDASEAAYRLTTHKLLEHFRAKADKPTDTITRRDAASFRDVLADRVSAPTVNKHMKIARMIWADAVRDSVCRDNVFAAVGRVKEGAKNRRRAFTLPELRSILDACDDDWRGMVLIGLYTGQRLGDCAALTWRAIDLQNETIHFTTAKTGKSVNIPIATPLLRYLMGRPSADDPDAPLFPTLAGHGSSYLSNRFYEVLSEAALAPPRTHAKTKKGRDTRREVGGLSFHCLRHTATSLLKNAGVSGVVAQEIIGHQSEAVSRTYTHIENSTLREAVNKMPDVLSEKSP